MIDTPDPLDSFTVPIGAVQPSQLFVNGEKLASVVERFDFDEPDDGALPVRRIGGEWVLTDGHTRALCAALAGSEELRLSEDPDELPIDLYTECVEWCKQEGVTRIEDLFGRVVGPEEFENRWIERCRRAGRRLGDE